jgi:hypothetical protein
MPRTDESVLDELNGASEQHGLAGYLVMKPDYAEHQFPEAFEDIQVLLPHLQKLPPEQLPVLDWTVFYSRRRELSPEETKVLVDDDIGALVGAIDAGGLLAYGRGMLLHNTDSGVGPYADFNFTPNCFSWCLWMSHADARNGANSPKHRDAVSRARQWFGRDFQIVKLRTTVQNGKLVFERIPLVHHGKHAHTPHAGNVPDPSR